MAAKSLSNRGEGGGVDRHPLDHLDPHAQAMLAQQVAQHLAVHQIDGRQALDSASAVSGLGINAKSGRLAALTDV